METKIVHICEMNGKPARNALRLIAGRWALQATIYHDGMSWYVKDYLTMRALPFSSYARAKAYAKTI